MGPIYKQLPIKPDIVRGTAWVQMEGGKLLNIGSATVEVTPKVDLTEVRSNEDPLRRVTDLIPTDYSCSVKITAERRPEIVAAISVMGVASKLTQDAITDREVTFTNMEVGDYFELRDADGNLVTNATISAIVDGTALTPKTYTSAMYRFNPESGRGQITAKPAGANSTLKVTFSADEVTEADNISDIAMLEAGIMLGRFLVEGNNLSGENYEYDWTLGNFAADSGSIKVISDGKDGEKYSLMFTALYDPNNPKYPLGRQRQLKKLTA